MSGQVPVGGGISVAVPPGWTVGGTSDGQVELDRPGITAVTVKLWPAQPSTGPILSSAQNELASGQIPYTWQGVTDLPASGKARQVSATPFVTHAYIGPSNSLINLHGTLLAVARPDTGITLFVVTRSNADESADVETMLASVEQ